MLARYCHFKAHYKIIAIDSSKQKALNNDPRVIPQINFIRNLDFSGNATRFFTLEETKETILDFSHERVIIF